MESKSNGRFTLGKQSSLAPSGSDEEGWAGVPDEIDANIRLMYMANEGDVGGIGELLDSGVDVNFRDIDGRTALHVAACQGFADVVRLLLDKGAQVDPQDCWGSTVSGNAPPFPPPSMYCLLALPLFLELMLISVNHPGVAFLKYDGRNRVTIMLVSAWRVQEYRSKTFAVHSPFKLSSLLNSEINGKEGEGG